MPAVSRSWPETLAPVPQVTRLAAMAVGVGGTLFGLFAAPLAWYQVHLLAPWFAVGVVPALLALPPLMVAAAWWARVPTAAIVTGTFAAVYLLGVATWPAVLADPLPMGDDPPFLWYLLGPAVAAAAVAVPGRLAMTYGLLTPAAFGAVRYSPSGGAVDAAIAAQDALFALSFGLLLVGAMTVLRRGAVALHRAGLGARDAATTAAAAQARDTERAHLDALVHDSIMSTLLAAGRSTNATPHPAVVRDARRALRALDALRADVEDPSPSSPDELAAQLRTAAASSGLPVDLSVDGSWHRTDEIPGDVARAIAAATAEAARNSARHATAADAEIPCHVTLSGRDGRLVVEISDDGAGFDTGNVVPNRLGLEVSIRQRMAALHGGGALIDSVPEEGTTVTLWWQPA